MTRYIVCKRNNPNIRQDDLVFMDEEYEIQDYCGVAAALNSEIVAPKHFYFTELNEHKYTNSSFLILKIRRHLRLLNTHL